MAGGQGGRLRQEVKAGGQSGPREVKAGSQGWDQGRVKAFR